MHRSPGADFTPRVLFRAADIPSTSLGRPSSWAAGPPFPGRSGRRYNDRRCVSEGRPVTLPDFLTEWPGGEIVLTGHRIGLYSVVNCFNEGYSPEMIVCEFPTLPLALVYKVIGFYLENEKEVDQYVAKTRAEIDR